jgi:hypothetical protein
MITIDVDSCCVGLSIDSSTSAVHAYASPRAWRALITRCNVVDGSRRSPSYESRLEKYARRGFAVYVPNFNVNDVDPQRIRVRNAYCMRSRGFEYLLWGNHRKLTREDVNRTTKEEDYQPSLRNLT